jgi:hypothetical protein
MIEIATEGFTMQPRLKLYLGDETIGAPAEVSMKLDEFTNILREAMKWDSTWLHDFADDEVRVSSDLYEILSLYSSMRPSA